MNRFEEEACSLIYSILENSLSPVSGSNIGLQLRSRYPDVDMRSEYGGLRTFIETHCGDNVVVAGKAGADDTYMHSSRSQYLATQSIPEATTQLTHWQAFSNPDQRFGLAIDINTGDARLLYSDDPLPDGFVRIRKLNREDFRTMARDFLPSIRTERRTEFEKTLDLDDFWSSWSNLLYVNRDQGTYGEWLTFRGESIVRLLAQRLEEAGLNPTLHGSVVQKIAKSRRPATTKARPPERGLAPPQQRSTTELDIRNIARAILESMADDDLRRLWVPLGSVQDAIKAIRR